MKKLLLAGLLVVAGSVFAADYNAPKAESEAEIGVKAEVLDDLVIAKTQDVNFGVLRKGATKDDPEEDGEFTINGSKGTKVTISAKDINGSNDYTVINNDSPIPVVLSLTGVTPHDNNKALKQMTSLLKIYDNDGIQVRSDVTLDSGDYEYGTSKNYTSTFKVKGSVSTDPGQFGGVYKGTLMVKVKHTGWLDGSSKQN